mgnify:CR=1 FL=1
MSDLLLLKLKEIEAKAEPAPLEKFPPIEYERKKIENLIRLSIGESLKRNFEEIVKIISPKFLLETWQDGSLAKIGGEAICLLAKDTTLSFASDFRKMVIKIAHFRTRDKKENLLRFQRSYGIQAGLHKKIGRGIPDVYETGDFFIIQELVPGIDLLEFAKKNSHEELYKTFFDLAKTLAQVHDAGIVHRDIKPQNILVGKYPVFLDWGYASEWEKKSNITPEGYAIGTNLFMHEDIKNDGVKASPKHDIHSFCSVLWCAFVGKIPSEEIEYQVELLKFNELPKWAEIYQNGISGLYGNDINAIALELEKMAKPDDKKIENKCQECPAVNILKEIAESLKRISPSIKSNP